MSSLRNVRRLEILALIETDIDEIAEELVELSTLKSLYLRHEELTWLQELHVMSENNINLVELSSLSSLTALSLEVCTGGWFKENFVFPKLQRYVIFVNTNRFEDWQGLAFRTLKIEDLSSSLSELKNLFYNVEELRLEEVNELTCLWLKSWDERKTPLLSDLIFLKLDSLPDLKSI
ncbi:hypothetical protein V6N13_037695 [Hibiscus sabdariffa]|uniref:Uncharacterized protein n=1 Tax=Hibiscus sabdariffa TaxID=183260 RepID=A0ABR2S553_9ROSI